MNHRTVIAGLVAALTSAAVPLAAQAGEQRWITESNRFAQQLLEITTRYTPEGASQLGIEGHDAEIMDLKPRFAERHEADLQAAATRLTAARASVRDPLVRQDLDILIDAAREERQSSILSRKYLLTFFDLPQALYSGFEGLLDPRVAKARHKAALARLHRYVGGERGSQPITRLMRARYEESAADGKRLGPWRVEVEQYLDNQNRYLDGIQQLFEKAGLEGWKPDLDALRAQVADYGAWVRATVLPRARQTNQLPAELYADRLKTTGVTLAPAEIMERALASYRQTREELQSVAAIVAAQRKLPSADYRDVIRALKKARIPKDKLLDLYTKRLGQIEDIVRRERLVTLPTRPAIIRLATDAENAASPAPHMNPPRLIGNTGEQGEFVLTTANPSAKSEMDDFSYDSVAWTLTAHEARPGHELQFVGMVERGVSTARAVFAFNSANAEGWGLYSEALIKPYMPPEGQLGVLQLRMMREARAFLDPMLNLGLMQPEDAKRFLQEEVVLSEAMAKQEVDRYTFSSPGQATAYFFGFLKLGAMRIRAELALPGRFNPQAFHDFILAQGLLPFDLLEKAVMEQFVPSQRAAK